MHAEASIHHLARSVWRELKSLHVRGSIYYPCSAMGAGMMKSTSEHERKAMQWFVPGHSRRKTVIGYYSSTLLFIWLYDGRDLNWGYRKEVLPVSVRKSQSTLSESPIL